MPRYITRYGAMRLLGVFSGEGKNEYERSDDVIVRTSRGLETGTVLCEATEEAEGQFKESPGGQIVRIMSSGDRGDFSRIQENSRHDGCQR
jgi:cell fate regulator YaaT (PSP1 superfamily)